MTMETERNRARQKNRDRRTDRANERGRKKERKSEHYKAKTFLLSETWLAGAKETPVQVSPNTSGCCHQRAVEETSTTVTKLNF